VYGVEWLIGLGLLALAAGLGGGYLLAGRIGSGAGRVRELEAELASARQELGAYRQEVVAQFSETARKFQSLNDSYTDLHQQLAKSSSILCKDVSGPLLAAPAGHQDLIPAEVRKADTSDGREADGEAMRAEREPQPATGGEPPASRPDAALPKDPALRKDAVSPKDAASPEGTALQNDSAAPEDAAAPQDTALPEDDEPPTLRERVEPPPAPQPTPAAAARADAAPARAEYSAPHPSARRGGDPEIRVSEPRAPTPGAQPPADVAGEEPRRTAAPGQSEPARDRQAAGRA
jgi:uncharacterized membrane-anchored protein YhcB (DUF1043 family)